MPQPYMYTDTPKDCPDCHRAIPLPRHVRTKRCAPCQKVSLTKRKRETEDRRHLELSREGKWPICAVDGCEVGSRTSRGEFCSAHHARNRRGQDMNMPIARRKSKRGVCRIEGCERPESARGMCGVHSKWTTDEWKPETQAQLRNCMKCGEVFESSGIGNRMCHQCRRISESPYAI